MSVGEALALARSLQRPGDGPLYLVGGLLRDHLLGRPCADLDLACTGPAGPLARRAARRLKGRLVLLDAAHQVYRIVLRAGPFAQVDLARLEAGTLARDLARRDFTVNAMAFAVTPGVRGAGSGVRKQILDPHGGLQDVRTRTLRMVSENAFVEDGLRLLRAFRLAAELGLRIDASTLRAIQRRRARVRRAAGERVQSELMRLFERPDSAAWIRRMDACGLLTEVLPELRRLRRCARAYYGPGGVMEHSLRTLERLELLLGGLDRHYPDLAPDLRRHLAARSAPGGSYPALLKLTALLHDIAKPATARPIGGRLRFFGHEAAGARMAQKTMERLRFSRADQRACALMVRHHLRPGNLAANPTVSDKAVFRFFQELGDEGVGLLLVCWADYASYLSDAQLSKVLAQLERDATRNPQPATLNPALRKTYRHLQVVNRLLHAWFKRRPTVSPPRLVDGNDAMRVLGLPPGPEIGRVLGLLREAQAGGQLTTRSQALEFLRRHRPKPA